MTINKTKPKVIDGAVWHKAKDFYTGHIEVKDSYEWNGIDLKGLKIPVKMSLNKYKDFNDPGCKKPSFFIELNDWQPKGSDGKVSKAEHAMALAASIRQNIQGPLTPTPKQEIQEPTFDDIPF
jgi:hypothetical protein